MGDTTAVDELAAELIEQHPCPRCTVEPGSACRTHIGTVATTYHTGRYDQLPKLRSGPAVKVPANRQPGKPWKAGTTPVRLATVPDRNGDRVGYCRVSSRGQALDTQLEALTQAGCVRIFSEKISTRQKIRPQYLAALESLRTGDIFTINTLDRLGRNMVELILCAQDLEARGMRLEILSGAMAGIYNPHGMGKMFFALFAGIAEAEREFIRERTMDGLAIAEAKGHLGGRPSAVSEDDLVVALARRAKGESIPSIATLLGVGRSTLYRALELHGTSAATGGSESDTVRPVRARITGPGSGASPELIQRLQNRPATD
jgi:DNA invertase Pin-like site-specific DNA recombinase